MKYASTYRRLRSIFNNYFFPKNCLNCNVEGVWLCGNCKSSLFFLNKNFCPFCKRAHILFSVCNKCRDISGIHSVFSLFNYSDYLVQKIIKILKYRHIKDVMVDLESVFRGFLYKYKNLLMNEDAVIVPVPLRKYKKTERGFNQAEEIANIIGGILNVPVDLDLVIKSTLTDSQAELEESERYNNLEGAFSVIGKVPKSVIIVDDVFTTGSTVKEIAKILRSNGTENIQVVTFARG